MSENWGMALSVDKPKIRAAEEEQAPRLTPTARLPARGDGSGHALAGLLRKPKTRS
jgi:hypothetical protein